LARCGLSAPYQFSGSSLKTCPSIPFFEREHDQATRQKGGETMLKQALGPILAALVVCQPALSSQTATQNPDATQRAINAVNTYLAQLKLVCQNKNNNCVGTMTDPDTGESKTVDAGKLADATAALVRDAQAKYNRGELTGDSLTQFRTSIKTAMQQIRGAMTSSLSSTPSGKLKLEKFEAQCAAHRQAAKFRLIDDSPECTECDRVFAAASAICSLYIPICQPCFVICESVTIEQYFACQEQWCDGPGELP
jgi:hypothetical protein